MKEPQRETVVIVLAGGRGERLMPLTEHRAKPAVPFGGKYRIIDFVLSNCIHSGLNRIYIVPQYKYRSLIRHLNLGWDIFNPEKGEFLAISPPQMRVDNGWYQGTADAVYQNIYSLSIDQPSYVLVLSGDQIYRMDYRQLINFHLDREAELTVVAVEVDREEAKRFGILEVDKRLRAINFREKPMNPKSLPEKSDKYLASMGIYCFGSRVLIEELKSDMLDEDSEHDFGRNIIPRMIEKGRKVFTFPFQDEDGQPGYWRDIGTTEAYFEASIDLVGVQPKLNLYERDWPWRTFQRQLPPAKVVFQEIIKQSIISEGCIIDGGEVNHSILSPGVKVRKDTQVIDSIIMDDVEIQEGTRIVRAIIDKENVIPSSSVIEAGNMRYEGRFETSSTGIVVIPRKHPRWEGI